MPIPETWMVPPKSYEPLPDLKPTLKQYAKLFDLAAVGEKIGYPLFMKPYDGGGWRASPASPTRPRSKKAYDESGKMVMHLQKAVGAVRPLRAHHRLRAADHARCSTTPSRRCTTATP